jgi:O-antigen ligase
MKSTYTSQRFTAVFISFTALMFLALKFKANLSLGALICVVITGALITVINLYKIRLSPHVICAFAMLCAFALSYIGADFQTNVRDSLMMFAAALSGAWLITLIPYRMRQTVLLIPVLAGLLIFIMMFTALSGIKPANLLSVSVLQRFNINIAAVSGFLVLIFPLTLFYAYKNKTRKIFMFFAAACAASLLFTRSLNAVLLGAFSFILYVLFTRRKLKAAQYVLISGTIIILCAVTISALKQNALYYQTALEIFKTNILSGAGFGSYWTLFNYYNPNIANPLTANNIFLTLLAETGILGTAAFVCFLFVFYFTAAKKAARDGLNFFIITALSCFLIFNMSCGSFFAPTNMFFFFLIAFYPFKTYKARRKVQVPFYLAAALFISLTLLLSKPMLAGRFASRAVVPFINNDFSYSAKLLKKAVILDPKNPNLLLKLSDAYLGCYTQTKKDVYLFLAISAGEAALKRYTHSEALASSLEKLNNIRIQKL